MEASNLKLPEYQIEINHTSLGAHECTPHNIFQVEPLRRDPVTNNYSTVRKNDESLFTDIKLGNQHSSQANRQTNNLSAKAKGKENKLHERLRSKLRQFKQMPRLRKNIPLRQGKVARQELRSKSSSVEKRSRSRSVKNSLDGSTLSKFGNFIRRSRQKSAHSSLSRDRALKQTSSHKSPYLTQPVKRL